MSAATALVAGREALPQLAAGAVHAALERAGLQQANGVLLFLTGGQFRDVAPAVTAAARAAGCLQVAGAYTGGVFTESGWRLDGPAAAALALGDGLGLCPPRTGLPTLALACGPAAPSEWPPDLPDPWLGLAHDDGSRPPHAGAFAASRLSDRCSVGFNGTRAVTAISLGLQRLGDSQLIRTARGLDLLAISGHTALASLQRAVPASHRDPELKNLNTLWACVGEAGCERNLPVIAVHRERGEVTLGGLIHPGESLQWALRQPLAAERDMRQAVATAAEALATPPAFAVVASCLGRGPWFHGNSDRDLDQLRGRYPDLPIIGAYGTSQYLTNAQGLAAHQNAVGFALFAPDHGNAA